MLEKSFSIQGRSVRGQQVEWRSVATSPSSGGATSDSKLASDAPDVLPLLSRDDLEDTLRRLPPQAIRRVLRHGVVPVAWQPDHVHYAICGPKGAGYARRHGLPVVARIAVSDFHHGVRRVWGRKILAKATHGLAATRPQFSARKRVTPAQGAAFLILAPLPCVEFRLFAGQRPLGCGQRRPWLVFSLGHCLAPVLSVFASSRENCKAGRSRVMRTCRPIPSLCRCSGKPRCSASFCADCPA